MRSTTRMSVDLHHQYGILGTQSQTCPKQEGRETLVLYKAAKFYTC